MIEITPAGLLRLRLQSLDAHDIALAKLGRNSARDRSDIGFLVKCGALDAATLEDRFERELRPYVLNEERSRTTLELWLEEFF